MITINPLYTLKNSKIWYAPQGVGKRMGSKTYVHKQYADKIIPHDVFSSACEIFNRFRETSNPNISYNCVCYDTKTPGVVRFDSVIGFDTEREPVVGDMWRVNIEDKTVEKLYTEQIFHHKWLWVQRDYTGFDFEESYNWSKKWLTYLSCPSGYYNKWKVQLAERGLE